MSDSAQVAGKRKRASRFQFPFVDASVFFLWGSAQTIVLCLARISDLREKELHQNPPALATHFRATSELDHLTLPPLGSESPSLSGDSLDENGTRQD